MGLNYPAGIVAVLLGVISFYGMTYVVIALNTGWRFGYWIAGSVFGALMVLFSIFWLVNPVGPRGADARWIALGANRTQISQVTFNNKPLSTVSSYPSSPWQTPEQNEIIREHFAQRVSLVEQSDALVSATTNCLTTPPAALDEEEQKPCTEAQSLMPPPDKIPVIAGSAVAITPEARDTRFTLDSGALIGQTTIVPMTHDPRVAKNAIKGKQMGPAFRFLAIYDKGSIRKPPFVSLILFSLFFAFHISGLNRAEKRKLSPITV